MDGRLTTRDDQGLAFGRKLRTKDLTSTGPISLTAYDLTIVAPATDQAATRSQHDRGEGTSRRINERLLDEPADWQLT